MHTPNLRLDLSIAYTHIPKLDPLYGLRSVYTLSFTRMFKFCVQVLKSVRNWWSIQDTT